MNTPFTSFLRRAAAALACLLLVAGCLKERLFWSPDGSRAGVITADGLYLTNAAGSLSPLLVPRAYRVAWLADSQRLIVAHSRPVNDFATLARTLGPKRTLALTAKAEALWQQLQPLKSTKDLSTPKPDDVAVGLLLYLRERYPDRLKEKAGDEWKDLASLPAEVHTLSVARIVGDRIELGATLYEGLAKIFEIRPAPGGSAVVFGTHIDSSPDSDNGQQLLLSPIDGATPPKVVALQTSILPDWSPDGRSLFYFKSESQSSSDGSELRLGTLTSSTLLDTTGKIAAEPTNVAHVGLIFHEGNRVRVLRDGRVIFNAAEFHLPISAKDRDAREEFFVVNPADDSIARLFPRERLAALPQSLTNFELSPDEKQLLVTDENGKIWLLTLSEQRIEEIYEGFGKEDSIAPGWRLPGEFTYRKKIGQRIELVQRHGAAETVLSRSWPDEVLQQLTK